MTNQQNISRQQIAEELVEMLDSKFFKTLSEPVRVEILKFLLLNGRSDIATIAEHMPQDRSVVSRHLNLMHETGILSCEKESRHMFYDVDASEFLNKVESIAGKINACVKVCCPDCCP